MSNLVQIYASPWDDGQLVGIPLMEYRGSLPTAMIHGLPEGIGPGDWVKARFRPSAGNYYYAGPAPEVQHERRSAIPGWEWELS